VSRSGLGLLAWFEGNPIGPAIPAIEYPASNTAYREPGPEKRPELVQGLATMNARANPGGVIALLAAVRSWPGGRT